MAMNYIKTIVVSAGALVGLGFVPALIGSFGIAALTAGVAIGSATISVATVVGVWAGIWLGEFVAEQLKI